MILKIVISKTDYTSSQLEKIADVMIRKSDLFVDSGERKIFEASFTRLSVLSQVRRAVLAISRKF